MRSQASRAILSIAQNVLSIYLANLDGRLARIIPVEIRSALLAVESPDGIIHIKEQLAVPFWGDGHVEIVRSSFVVWFKHGLVASRGSDTGNHFEWLNEELPFERPVYNLKQPVGECQRRRVYPPGLTTTSPFFQGVSLLGSGAMILI